MPRVRFEPTIPVFERAVDSAANVIGWYPYQRALFVESNIALHLMQVCYEEC
jgi:hypothetical protein